MSTLEPSSSGLSTSGVSSRHGSATSSVQSGKTGMPSAARHRFVLILCMASAEASGADPT